MLDVLSALVCNPAPERQRARDHHPVRRRRRADGGPRRGDRPCRSDHARRDTRARLAGVLPDYRRDGQSNRRDGPVPRRPEDPVRQRAHRARRSQRPRVRHLAAADARLRRHARRPVPRHQAHRHEAVRRVLDRGAREGTAGADGGRHLRDRRHGARGRCRRRPGRLGQRPAAPSRGEAGSFGVDGRACAAHERHPAGPVAAGPRHAAERGACRRRHPAGANRRGGSAPGSCHRLSGGPENRVGGYLAQDGSRRSGPRPRRRRRRAGSVRGRDGLRPEPHAGSQVRRCAGAEDGATGSGAGAGPQARSRVRPCRDGGARRHLRGGVEGRGLRAGSRRSGPCPAHARRSQGPGDPRRGARAAAGRLPGAGGGDHGAVRARHAASGDRGPGSQPGLCRPRRHGRRRLADAREEWRRR